MGIFYTYVRIIYEVITLAYILVCVVIAYRQRILHDLPIE